MLSIEFEHNKRGWQIVITLNGGYELTLNMITFRDFYSDFKDD